MKSKKTVFAVGVIAIQFIINVLLFTLIITQLIGIAWRTEEVFVECHGEEYEYDDWGTYCVRILERQRTLQKDREIWITLEQDDSYGYQVPYKNNSYTSWNDQSELYHSVDWREDGVEINTHDVLIFVPSNKFQGAR